MFKSFCNFLIATRKTVRNGEAMCKFFKYLSIGEIDDDAEKSFMPGNR